MLGVRLDVVDILAELLLLSDALVDLLEDSVLEDEPDTLEDPE